jgi:hypothetical protein
LGRVEGLANLLVGLAVLLENVPQENKLCMKALLITQSCSRVYNCGKYGTLVGWVVKRAGV